jgi:ribosomal protein S18 acetylase RimI-like enzyme
MDALSLIPAAQFSSGRLTRLLNRAYADYYLPVWLDPYQFERMCADMDIDLRHSVVALVGEREVGLALLSRRGREGWVSGVGVRSTWRRLGVARQMVVYLQQQAKVERLERVRLEVLQQNEGAIRLYEQLGFSWERDLLGMTFSGEVTAPLCPSIDMASTQPAWLLQAYAAFHTCDASWQRDLPSLQKRAPKLQGLALWEEQQLVGYILYQPYHNALTILDLAVDPAHPDRLGTARRLLRGLHMAHPTIAATITNLPAQDPLLPAFIKVGYQISQRQYEMAWPVSQGPQRENCATSIAGVNHVRT